MRLGEHRDFEPEPWKVLGKGSGPERSNAVGIQVMPGDDENLQAPCSVSAFITILMSSVGEAL
jgi:hypothetical protein